MSDTKRRKDKKTAPDFSLPDVNHNPITLSKVLAAGKTAMVIFLRHLG
ncbi:hypothetical protein ACFLX7_04075 [Chloroflexota bacterium]